MANALNPNSRPAPYPGAAVGASVTNLPISSNWRMTARGSLHSRVDIYVGKVAVGTGITAKLQHSSGYGIWADAKTVAITASTDKTVSAVSTTTYNLTSTTHGYVEGQAVAISSTGAIPVGLVSGIPYYVRVVDADNVQLSSSMSGPAVPLTSAGSGTITLSAVRVFTIQHLVNVAGDQTHLPLRSSARVVLTSGASDSAQISDVVLLVED